MNREPSPTIENPAFDRHAGLIDLTEKLLSYFSTFYDLPAAQARNRVRYGFCIPVAYFWAGMSDDLIPIFGRAWHENGLNENHVWLQNCDGKIVDPVGWQWDSPVAAYLPAREADIRDMRKHMEKHYPGLTEILDSFIGG
jgi:hypothetical protein